MKRVMVVGAAGKMGSLTVRTVAAQPDMEVVAEVDPAFAGGVVAAGRFTTIEEALVAVRPDVAVEFSTPGSVAANAAALLSAGIDTLIGATGLTDDDVDRLAEAAAGGGARLLVVPNFSLGAVLMMRFATEAARHLPRAEIVEIHEEAKLDSPSGTSLRTARLMEEAGAAARPAGDETRASRGFGAGPVRIHSVRLPGVVAHQEVVFGGTDETLTIRHDSLSRESFMPGVLLALRDMERLQGTVVGLENLVF